MTSTMRATKLYIENLFFTKWTKTVIHYVGQEFDSTGITTWINVFYKPFNGTNLGLCETSVEAGNIFIGCWGKNDADVMELADDVISFINSNIDKKQYRLGRYEIVDHSWNETNDVFMLLSFDIEHL